MVELLKYVLSDFNIFVGFTIILYIVLLFVSGMWRDLWKSIGSKK